jgi:large-conductance mechanosensitive channel
MLNKIRAYVSSNPVVHVAIAAFIGAALPIIVPALESGDVGVPVVKVALAAGVAAVIRAVILLFPAS